MVKVTFTKFEENNIFLVMFDRRFALIIIFATLPVSYGTSYFAISNGGWNFYGVTTATTTTVMTNANIVATCNAAGLVPVCPGATGCAYNDASCTVTSETGCSNPMTTLANTYCGGATSATSCSYLNGFYAYGGTLCNSCGLVSGAYVSGQVCIYCYYYRYNYQ